MVFSKSKIDTDRLSSVLVNETKIDYVQKIEYLGFNFTSQNSDNDHVEYLYIGLCARSNMLLKNFSKCNDDVKKMLFQRKKDPQKATNYRPVALLEIPGKILERIINK